MEALGGGEGSMVSGPNKVGRDSCWPYGNSEWVGRYVSLEEGAWE